MRAQLAIYKIYVCILIFAGSTNHAEDLLTKKQAFQMMEKNGFKWKQTNLLTSEAEAKTMEASSAFQPHIGTAARTFLGRVNAAEYGLPDSQLPDYFLFASLLIQGQYTLFDASARARLEAAKLGEGLNRETKNQYKQELTYVMLLQYLNIQRLKRQLDTHEENIKRAEQLLRFAKTKAHIGAGIPLDIARAKSLLGSENLKKVMTYTKYMKSRQEMALLLGRQRVDEEIEPLTLNVVSDADLNSGLKEGLVNRADLKALKFGIEGAKELYEQARHETTPKIQALGEVGYTFTNAFHIPAVIPTSVIGVQISMPLWSGGYFQAKREEAAVQVEKVQLQYKQTELEVLSQVKEALGQLISAQQAIKISAEIMDTAKEEAEIASKRYYGGLSGAVEFSNSHANYVNAIDSNTEAIFGYEVAKVNFYKSTGNFQAYLNTAGDKNE